MRISDWSSDVCSSDLSARGEIPGQYDVTIEDRAHVVGHRLVHVIAFDQHAVDARDRTATAQSPAALQQFRQLAEHGRDRKSVVKGKRVSVRVGLGGRRSIKKTKKQLVAKTSN